MRMEPSVRSLSRAPIKAEEETRRQGQIEGHSSRQSLSPPAFTNLITLSSFLPSLISLLCHSCQRKPCERQREPFAQGDRPVLSWDTSLKCCWQAGRRIWPVCRIWLLLQNVLVCGHTAWAWAWACGRPCDQSMECNGSGQTAAS